MKFVKFPNGKLWRTDENFWIEGAVRVPRIGSFHDLEERNDAIAEAVTGSSGGLTEFSYTCLGNDLVSFLGYAEEFAQADANETGYKVIEPSSDEFKALLASQYGLTEGDIKHAIGAIGSDYDDECVLSIHGSARQIRCPADPDECSYVRVVLDGYEIAYWIMDELGEAPAEVMAALIGAARGSN